MELQHFSHKHILIHEDLKQEDSCSGRKKLASGSSYSCRNCSFFLHKACVELPRQIKHTFHRKHPLILQENQSDSTLFCHSCNDTICERFFYRCFLCNFNLDIKCALLLCILEPKDRRRHQFMMLMDSKIPYVCDGCGHDGSLDSWAYFCTICQLLIHSDCYPLVPYPNLVATKQHVHPLTYTFFLHENEPGKKHNCGICNCEFNADHGCYCCSECGFVSHWDCVFNYDDIEASSCFWVVEKVQDLSYSYIKFNSLTCAEMPPQTKHPFHRKHPLSLLSECFDLSNNWNYPHCYYCSKRCSRFVYSCSHCEQLYLDIDCATMPCVIDPQANQHRFIRWMRPIPFTCNACSENESDEAHFCTICQIKVHKSCISLPHTIKITQHDHPLDRNYFFHENVSAGSLNCGVREKEVNSEYGSYYCHHCDFIAHVRCCKSVIQKYVKIK